MSAIFTVLHAGAAHVCGRPMSINRFSEVVHRLPAVVCR